MEKITRESALKIYKRSLRFKGILLLVKQGYPFDLVLEKNLPTHYRNIAYYISKILEISVLDAHKHLIWNLHTYESWFSYFHSKLPAQEVERLTEKQARRIFKVMGFTNIKPSQPYYLESLTIPKYYMEMPEQFRLTHLAYHFQYLWGVPGYTRCNLPKK